MFSAMLEPRINAACTVIVVALYTCLGRNTPSFPVRGKTTFKSKLPNFDFAAPLLSL